jgi:hypothetical protein
MKSGISFKERAKLGREMLSRHRPLTYEEMLASVKMVRENQ